MCEVPEAASVYIRQQFIQELHQQPEDRRYGHADPEALEGAHHPPPGSETVQKTGAAAVAGERKSRPQGQGRAGGHTGRGKQTNNVYVCIDVCV